MAMEKKRTARVVQAKNAEKPALRWQTAIKSIRRLPYSGLFGLGLDTTDRLWFTAGGGQQANYVGVMAG